MEVNDCGRWIEQRLALLLMPELADAVGRAARDDAQALLPRQTGLAAALAEEDVSRSAVGLMQPGGMEMGEEDVCPSTSRRLLRFVDLHVHCFDAPAGAGVLFHLG